MAEAMCRQREKTEPHAILKFALYIVHDDMLQWYECIEVDSTRVNAPNIMGKLKSIIICSIVDYLPKS